MKTIKTHADLKELEHGPFPEPLVKFVSELFSGLCAECDGDGQSLRENPIFVCEAGDPLLQWLDEAPFGPEYVERIELTGLALYRVGVLQDNDAFVQYLIPAGTLDEETENWLAGSAGLGGEGR